MSKEIEEKLKSAKKNFATVLCRYFGSDAYRVSSYMLRQDDFNSALKILSEARIEYDKAFPKPVKTKKENENG